MQIITTCKLLTRKEIIDIWSKQPKEYLESYCCPNCRDLLNDEYICKNCELQIIIIKQDLPVQDKE